MDSFVQADVPSVPGRKNNASPHHLGAADDYVYEQIGTSVESQGEEVISQVAGSAEGEGGIGEPEHANSDADALLDAQIEGEINAHEQRKGPVVEQSSDNFVDAPSEAPLTDDTDEPEFVDASPDPVGESQVNGPMFKEELTSPAMEGASIFEDLTHISSDSTYISPTRELPPNSLQPQPSSSRSKKRKSAGDVPDVVNKKSKLLEAEDRFSIVSTQETTQPKRRRGRPRKSEGRPDTTSQTEAVIDVDGAQITAAPSMSSRASSLLSTASFTRRISHVQVTPSKSKKRKATEAARGQDMEQPAGTKAEATSEGTAASQGITPTPSRRIAQPKSIMDRLKEIALLVKGHVWGSLEEFHEADKMITEIRREAFRASERTERLEMEKRSGRRNE